MNAPLAELFRYNRWANLELYRFCAALPEERLNLRLGAASGPVRELLTHIAGAQQTFLLRAQGRQHEGELSRSSPWPGMAAVLDVVTTTSDALVTLAEQTEQEHTVDLPFQGAVYRFPVSFFLAHALAHGVEHRTEVKLTLQHHGIAAPDLDGWPYALAAGHGARVG